MQIAKLILILLLVVSGIMPAQLLADGLPISTTARQLSHPPQTYLDAMLSGGPGKDGIPSIDKPVFWDVAKANRFLDDNDIVFGVYHNGVARAYPQRIVVWHEIVNDIVGGKPLSITYCPLTATAIGFERGTTTLGVSGNLINSNMVMYDRATDSYWPQIPAVAIKGPHQNKTLREHRVIWTTWARWKQRHPQTEVLSDNTGFFRNYKRDPYGQYNPVEGYYLEGAPIMFPVLHESNRFDAKKTMLGFRAGKTAVAVTFETLIKERIKQITAEDARYVVIYDAGLDTAWVYRADGAVDIDYRRIRFGHAGPEADVLKDLQPVNAFKVLWFAWQAYYPDTLVY